MSNLIMKEKLKEKRHERFKEVFYDKFKSTNIIIDDLDNIKNITRSPKEISLNFPAESFIFQRWDGQPLIIDNYFINLFRNEILGYTYNPQTKSIENNHHVENCSIELMSYAVNFSDNEYTIMSYYTRKADYYDDSSSKTPRLIESSTFKVFTLDLDAFTYLIDILKSSNVPDMDILLDFFDEYKDRFAKETESSIDMYYKNISQEEIKLLTRSFTLSKVITLYMISQHLKEINRVKDVAYDKLKSDKSKSISKFKNVKDLVFIRNKNKSNNYYSKNSIESIEYSHQFLVLGHWRRLKNPKTAGKDSFGNRYDKYGNPISLGKTWVSAFTKGGKDKEFKNQTKVVANPIYEGDRMRTTIHKPLECEIISYYELPKSAQKEFDYEGADESQYFEYNGDYFDLNQFMMFDKQSVGELSEWDGWLSSTYFSGYVVKVAPRGDGLVCAMYYSE